MWTKAGKMKTKKGVELPSSLIESEILARVAGKSDIGRCRCVCKQWRSFLSTPAFGRMHLQLHGTTIDDHKLLLLDGATLRTLSHSTTSIIPPCNPEPEHVLFVASLDGLVCLASPKVPNTLVFWNPLTGAYRKGSFKPPAHVDFAYSPLDVVGFYKKDSSNDYRLVYLRSGGYFGAYVYSHRRDTCWEIGFDYSSLGPAAAASRGSTAWSPATLWGQCVYFSVTAYRAGWWIICFDVETETFRKICVPPPVPTGDDDDDDIINYAANLVVLNGCLHLYASYVTFINNICLKQCNLWRMMDDGWVKVAVFSDPKDDVVFTLRRQRIVCTASAGNWLTVLDEDKNCFKKVNLEDFTTHYRCFTFPSIGYTCGRMIYVETLVSPDPF